MILSFKSVLQVTVTKAQALKKDHTLSAFMHKEHVAQWLLSFFFV